jgi:hypothetical protein
MVYPWVIGNVGMRVTLSVPFLKVWQPNIIMSTISLGYLLGSKSAHKVGDKISALHQFDTKNTAKCHLGDDHLNASILKRSSGYLVNASVFMLQVIGICLMLWI